MSVVTYLAKLGELTLKGGNLKDFEQRLVQNAQLLLEGKKTRVQLRAGRMYIEADEIQSVHIEWTLKHLIGITAWAKVLVCEKNIESIRAAVVSCALKAKESGAKTFKIEARRADKSFPLNSYQLCAQAAEPVFDKGLLGVDVHTPDVTIRVEVRERCFVYGDDHKGCRGLPVGTGGRGLLLLSGGIDSPVAGYRMLRRGMKVDCIYFHSYPYTSDEAQKKVEDLAKIIGIYGISTHLNIIPFTEVQMRIKERAPQEFTTLLLRMCMIKTANIVAAHIGAKCIITGESLGQVASQTIENMSVTESVCDFPLLRPLVGLDKEEIIETARYIDSYPISILPYEDCCTLFSPKHPVLRSSVREAADLYEALEIDDLIQCAYDNRKVQRYSLQCS